jgi:hypothetical protein
MRTLTLIVAAALLSPAVGCNWMKEWRNGADQRGPVGQGKIPEVTPDQLVSYLNDRAARLQSLEYGNTRMRVSGKGIPVPATLDGNLACAQPRNFRMVSSGRVAAAKVDMGSNPEQFWVYVAAPGDAPLYVFASHDDFERGKAKMPGGIPFEPDFVMQALGMTTFAPTNEYEEAAAPVSRPATRVSLSNPPLPPAGSRTSVPINEKDRTYTLRWRAKTPAGLPVFKEVVFDADAATGTRPQVKKHLIREAAGNKVIASAEIKAAETVRVGTDPKSGVPLAAQYPTHVVLRWEEQKFEMDLLLEKAQVNQADTTRAALFTRPDIRGATPIDLAKYEFQPLK